MVDKSFYDIPFICKSNNVSDSKKQLHSKSKSNRQTKKIEKRPIFW